MKTVTAFVGSARKKHTYGAARTFLDNLEKLGDVRTELIVLSDYRLETCRGCLNCFNKGEEFCPYKDDRDLLIQKISASDGVVFATPVYSFQVSGFTKIFLDRLGFLFHRPRFFGKTFTSIAVQGIYGGNKVIKYLDFCANGLGFTTVKGSCLTSLEPMTEKGRKKTQDALARQSKRFWVQLMRPGLPAPNLLKLMAFRMARTNLKLMLNEGFKDFRYYRDHGWFDSAYYYPTQLSAWKKAGGYLFDALATQMATHRDT